MKRKFNIIQSHNFVKTVNLCDDTKEFLTFSILTGDPGQGKTVSLVFYKNNNENVIYIPVKKSMSPKVFLSTVLKEITSQDVDEKMGLHYYIFEIARALNQTPVHKILIFDEAGKLSRRIFMLIQEIRDETENITGILLSAPPYFRKHVKRWISDGVVGMEELERRFSHGATLDSPTALEIRKVLEVNDFNDKDFILECQAECKRFSDIEIKMIEYIIREKRNKKNKKNDNGKDSESKD